MKRSLWLPILLALLLAAFTPTGPGHYRFYCGSPGHAAAGMAGVFVVEP